MPMEARLPKKLTKKRKRHKIIYLSSLWVSELFLPSAPSELISPEKASERVNQRLFVSICVGHLSDAVWSKRV
jgi:hypothetical protein